MQKVLFTLKTPTAELDKNGKPVIRYTDSTEEVIVASTKSRKKAERDYASKGVTVVSAKPVDLFLDREIVEMGVDGIVDEAVKDEKIRPAIAKFIKSKLAGACLYAKVEEETEE